MARGAPVIEQPPGLAELVIANARRYDTGKPLETDGSNDGPEIRGWLRLWGIAHPAPWCAAFACFQIVEACGGLALYKHGLTFRGSAGALRLLDLNPELILAAPETGCLVVWDHGEGKGHVGIVTGVTMVGGDLASIQVISGNTNLEGSRDGNAVVERGFPFPQARKLAGYVRVA